MRNHSLKFLLFEKYEEYGQNKAGEGCDVIPLQPLSLKEEGDNEGEHCQGDNFLNNFELHQVERTSVIYESDAVCRNLGAVFEKCYCPGKQNDQNKGPAC